MQGPGEHVRIARVCSDISTHPSHAPVRARLVKKRAALVPILISLHCSSKLPAIDTHKGRFHVLQEKLAFMVWAQDDLAEAALSTVTLHIIKWDSTRQGPSLLVRFFTVV